MKRVYIDASVCNVLLFGEEKEAERFSHVVQLFEVINSETLLTSFHIFTLRNYLINGVRMLKPAFDGSQANQVIAAVEGAKLLPPLWSDLSRLLLRPLSFDL